MMVCNIVIDTFSSQSVFFNFEEHGVIIKQRSQ